MSSSPSNGPKRYTSSNSCQYPPHKTLRRYRNDSFRSGMLATKMPAGCMRSPCATIVPLVASTTDIASASGSMARTYRPTEVLCMPRKANGSPCVPAAIASTSGLRRRGICLPAHLGQDAQDPVQWDRHPFRPIGELVAHFIDGFFKREEIDQRLRLQLARGT